MLLLIPEYAANAIAYKNTTKYPLKCRSLTAQKTPRFFGTVYIPRTANGLLTMYQPKPR
jgi:hypothetical protein